MHIAIDISPTQSGHKYRGTGVYTEQLIESLKKYKPEHVYTYFVGGERIPEHADLVHYPYFDPFFLTLPIAKKIPTVVTVHDLIPIEYPSRFPAGVRGKVKWLIQRFSLGGVKRILTDSKSSKRAISSLANISDEKIDVIYLAPREAFARVRDDQKKAFVSRKYKLPDEFVIFIGDVNWNKNVPGLLDAFSIVCARVGFEETRLVLAGKAFLDDTLLETSQINALIKKLHLESNVVKTGFIEEEDLSTVYSLAAVAVQPSFAEGFGLPTLEAMACEVPTIVSNRSSLVEIAGPSLVIDPDSPNDLASAIIAILSLDDDKKAKIGKKAKAWSQEFSWKKVALDTTDSYDRALAL